MDNKELIKKVKKEMVQDSYDSENPPEIQKQIRDVFEENESYFEAVAEEIRMDVWDNLHTIILNCEADGYFYIKTKDGDLASPEQVWEYLIKKLKKGSP